MELHLTPLTPLWTGDVDGVSRELRVPGLMGSLRWWFEGIVRASGRDACDPTEGGCQYDGDRKKRPFHNLCPACWLFGATGWARRFRLTASGLHASDWCVLAAPAVAAAHRNWLKRIYERPGQKVLWGDNLAVHVTHHFPGELETPGDADLDGVFCGLIAVITRFGAIAAKAQNGWGVVEWSERPQFDTKALERFIAAFPEGRGDSAGMFNIAETWFFEFTIPDPGVYATSQAVRIPESVHPDYLKRVLPAAYDIRYKSLAKHFRTGAGQDRGLRPTLKKLLGRQAEELTGTAARSYQRSASRVFVSHLYRHSPNEPYRMRIWVHVPPDLASRRQAVAESIRSFIVDEMFRGSHCKQYEWAEVRKEVM